MTFIQEMLGDSGRISMMRVMSLACCVTAVLLGVIGLCKAQVDYSGLSLLCATFLSVAFTGKVAQKHIENRNKS